VLLQPRSSLCCKRPQATNSGATLIELMVVMGLCIVIAVILFGLLSQSSAMIAKGTASMGLNQRARTAIDRIGPYVLTAVARGDGSLAVDTPDDKMGTPGEPQLTSYKNIRFSTTEDFLNPAGYDPRVEWEAGSPVFFYEIYFDNQTRPTPYELENGEVINLGQILLRKCRNSTYEPSDPDDPTDEAMPPQALAHNVQFFRCHRVTARNIEVIVHTVGKRKGPQGNLIDVFEEARGILTTPAPFYR
jgi:hypothetical protein